jgi:hypothetical protein
VIFALFLVGGAFLVLGFVLFDKVLKFQYHNYRTEWENAGKVRGFFFIPSESSWFGGSLQRNVRLLSWIFGDENWVRNEASVLRTLLLMRLCIMGSWIFGGAVVFLSIKNGG